MVENLNGKIQKFIDYFGISPYCPFYKIYNIYLILDFSDLANVYDIRIVIRKKRGEI